MGDRIGLLQSYPYWIQYQPVRIKLYGTIDYSQTHYQELLGLLGTHMLWLCQTGLLPLHLDLSNSGNPKTWDKGSTLSLFL